MLFSKWQKCNIHKCLCSAYLITLLPFIWNANVSSITPGHNTSSKKRFLYSCGTMYLLTYKKIHIPDFVHFRCTMYATMFAFISIVLAVILFQLYSNQVNYTHILLMNWLKNIFLLTKIFLHWILIFYLTLKKTYWVKKM